MADLFPQGSKGNQYSSQKLSSFSRIWYLLSAACCPRVMLGIKEY